MASFVINILHTILQTRSEMMAHFFFKFMLLNLLFVPCYFEFAVKALFCRSENFADVMVHDPSIMHSC